MRTDKWVESSQRLYHWLLRLYPQTYRTNYETEMFNLFTDQCREACREQGKLGILSLWLHILADTGVSVAREHLSDPNAKAGLLESIPNAPLPWKGVLLVSIPGLIFFINQIQQLISDSAWYFMMFHGANYFLILPVLLVWLTTRRFPIWGLIPFGLLYRTLLSYGGDFQLFADIRFWFIKTALWLGPHINKYGLKSLLVAFACMILLGTLIGYNIRRRQISRNVWKWLGLYGLLTALQIMGNAYSIHEGLPQNNTMLVNLYHSLSFLLLIFIGMLFARKYGELTFLLLLGYLLPTIIFGSYGNGEPVPFYLVSIVVLVYRFLVALVAPVWLVRAASASGRQHAAVFPVGIAVACQVSFTLVVSLEWASQMGYPITVLDLALDIWRPLIIAAGLGLAVALYLPGGEDRTVLSPPAVSAAAE